MVPQVKIDRIVEALRNGRLPRAVIARINGVSPHTVASIANGRHTLIGSEEDPRYDEKPLEYAKCGACGHVVSVPCVKCRADQRKRDIKAGRILPTPHVEHQRLTDDPITPEVIAERKGHLRTLHLHKKLQEPSPEVA